MKIENSHITKHAWITPVILAGMIAIYTLIIGAWSVNRFMSFNATLWDMGLMLQAIWNTAHGRILYESVNLGFPISRLAMAHWELIYLPLAVIYRIMPSVPLLLYLQSFVLACGVIPIYKFAVKKLSSELAALLIALAYLFYPALHGANLFDLHGLTFATTFLLFTFYYLDEEKPTPAIGFAILSLSCREDVAFVIFMLGLFGWIIKQKRKISLPLLIISATWMIAFLTRTKFTGLAEATSMIPNWQHLGLTSFFHSPLQTVLAVARFLFASENIKYITKLILPVVGLCCLAPEILMIAAPTLLLNLLSNWPQMHQIEYHYTAAITPFIFLATIKGIANLKLLLARFHKFQANRIQLAFSSVVVLASIISTTQFSILRFHKTWRVSEGDKILSQKLQEIPSELSVSATARAGAHLSARRQLYHFPDHATDAEIVVIELNRPEVEIKNFSGKSRTQKAPSMNAITRAAMQDTSFGLRFAVDHVFCLQRGIDSPKSFADEAIRDSIPADSYQITNVNLGHGLFLLGWKLIYLSSEQAHILLYWSIQQQQPAGTKLSFYLQSDNGIAEIDHRPIFGRLKLEEWSAGKIYCDHLFVNRPKDSGNATFSIMARSSSNHNSTMHPLFNFTFPAAN